MFDLKRFEDIILNCCTVERLKRAPVGKALEMFPEETKEFLRTLKSDDIKNMRIQDWW
jgi:hypothetical protein